MAFDPRLIDDLARRLAGAVPENFVAIRRDLEQNFKGVLKSQLERPILDDRDLARRPRFFHRQTWHSSIGFSPCS